MNRGAQCLCIVVPHFILMSSNTVSVLISCNFFIELGTNHCLIYDVMILKIVLKYKQPQVGESKDP